MAAQFPAPGLQPGAPTAQPSLGGPGGQQPPPRKPPGPLPGPPAPEIPLHSGVESHQPDAPTVRFDTQPIAKLSESEWNALSSDLYQSYTASDSARRALNLNLKDWSQHYDMIPREKDWPWEDSSNVTLPYIPAQLESMVAYIAGAVLQPRLYIVSGNTTQAASDAAKVEKYYNAELVRLRVDGSSYFQRFIDTLQLSLRDGTGVVEELWTRRRQRKRAVAYVPKTDDDGVPMLDERGQPVWVEQVQETDVYVKDYAEYRNVPLKEFGLIPNESLSIEQAVGCWTVDWLYEDQLDRMVRNGHLDSEEVERALAMVESGNTEVAGDRSGTYDKSASEQIGIGVGQGTLTSKFFKNRGPIRAIRVHSRQYDMNGDGIPEENVFWLHERGQRLLGWMPYEYATGQRPFFSFCPFPRPDSFYGYSLIERLSGVAIELDATHNNRNDQITFRLNPPMQIRTGSELLDKKGIWGPGRYIEVESLEGPDKTMSLVDLPEIPLASWQQEALDKQYGNEYTGLSQPAIGGQSSGRRSATELRQQNASAGTRLNLVNTRFRVFIGQVVSFNHLLNKQYLREDPQTISEQQVYTLPLATLDQDFTIGVAGATDPIDSTTRRNETMTLFDIALKVPGVLQSPKRLYYWLRMLLEAFGRPDIQQLIGTEQEADTAEQAAVQARASAMQMQQAQAAHLNAKSGGGQQPQVRAA